jgi:hypothetical protein
MFLPFPWRDRISLATIFVQNVLPWLRRQQGKLIFLPGQQTRKTCSLDGLWPPSNTSLTWRSMAVKEMQLLGGQTPPRKYDYLAVYYPQENVFTWRLVTPKKINFLDYRLIFLSSWQSVVCPCFPWRVGSQGNLA